ncbi:hypothetical protein A2483_00060 [Candidatus Peregrinibacteria bacterium RIFOXYC2_FULL_33_13]|nr:MAG: hypothetical protein UR27_C0007G0005 [Candidatus Peregrinibacteria bacterium GW2011_GWA2_33_10]KKP40934.1 MAG: hypothetical protein UR30_C0003G0106 [Candidatus Peregrinibacteria bacterium GW2011_GWC2_33_13]OGJ52367.1 MAG: hypothetical protein A2483_00060 [Candidatus Peregrinibacteria bacterium RIFOXYC2_FULL_33_13]
MSTKLTATVISAIFVVSLTVFGIGNALALSRGIVDTTTKPLSTPVSAVVYNCKEAQAAFNVAKGEMQAKALSTEMGERQLRANIAQLRAYYLQECVDTIQSN